jgi:hypothetical protein
MRRVVGDQIKALSDLSEIITRHGKQLDLSSPALGEPRARVSEAHFAAGSEAGAEPLAPSRYAERRNGSTNGNGNGNGATAKPALSARPMPRPLAATPAPRLTPESNGEGWVSDLLRRASTEEDLNGATPHHEEPAPPAARETIAQVEPAPATTQSSAPLNAISADIAKAIDHDAAVELWERQRRGERNLFTRRLYTMQGQQTFDEIRKKYQRDAEFRSVVDHYVSDFEKLLTEAGSKDSRVSQQYLISDTGKVYTMLAHASGRFD